MTAERVRRFFGLGGSSSGGGRPFANENGAAEGHGEPTVFNSRVYMEYDVFDDSESDLGWEES